MHEKIVVDIVSAGIMAEHKMQATVFFVENLLIFVYNLLCIGLV